MPARDSDRRPGRKNHGASAPIARRLRPDAQRQVPYVAQIPHRGDPGGERRASRGSHLRKQFLVIVSERADWVGRAWEDKVDMCINEPGKQRHAAVIVNLGIT
jgi:hypothetical protein